MHLALAIVHLIVCFALILIVLLQTGKGSQMGSAFGGGASQTLFGTRGATTLFSKLTTVAAIVFMLTSLSLAMLSAARRTSSVVKEETTTKSPEMPPPSPPAQKAPASTPNPSPPAR